MKRKSVIFLVVIALLLTAALLISCKDEEATYTVTFDSAGGAAVEAQSVESGAKATKPVAPTRDGYIFSGWYSGETEWNFEEDTVGANVTLTAKWTEIPPTVYTVTFRADGKTIDTVSFTSVTQVINKPEVPAKAGYTGEWESFNLLGQNIIVNAVYTPITYTVTFKADGVEVGIREFTVENGEISQPDVPLKKGYIAKWESYILGTKNITVEAIYTPITYTVTFKADGDLVATRKFTVTHTEFDIPLVPKKTGYTGVWESYELGANNVTVNAVYTPITYTATFIVGGVEIGKREFTVEDTQLDAPTVPDKQGYTKAWESYTLGAENITVNAVYTPIVYTVTFMADGQEIAKREFTVESKQFNIPSVPKKAGYAGAWESYELGFESIVVNAVYTAGEYYVTFMVEQTEIGKVAFTVENMTVTEPIVPYRQCYIGVWESYTLTLDNITVYAVYTLSHTALTHVPAAAPQCNKLGNTEYWACAGCNKYFSDAQGTLEITDKDSVLIDTVSCNYVDCICEWCGAKNHSLTHYARVEAQCNKTGNIEYWYCSSCEKSFTDEAAENETERIALETVDCYYVDCICKWCGDTDHKLIHYERVDAQCNKTGYIEHWYCSRCEKSFATYEADNVIENVVLEKVDCSYVNWICKWCGESKIITLDEYIALDKDGKKTYNGGFETNSDFIAWYREAYYLSGRNGSYYSKTGYMESFNKSGFPPILLTWEEYLACSDFGDWRIQSAYSNSFADAASFDAWFDEARRIYGVEQEEINKNSGIEGDIG